MIEPTITLGGTNPEVLEEQYHNAIKAIRSAMDAMKETVPNGRDYPGDHLGLAIAEHCRRLARLKGILHEIQLLHGGVLVQMETRPKRSGKEGQP